MTTKKAFFQLLYLVVLSLFSECMTLEATTIISNTSNLSVGCVEMERTVLLKFKGSLNDPLGRLSSWADENCCEWEGVGCDNQTGNVVTLNLKSSILCAQESLHEAEAHNLSCLGGSIPTSIGKLTSLEKLDLSFNSFSGSIPASIRNLTSLEVLDLSHNSFSGSIPTSIGKLSSLKKLDLSSNLFSGSIPSSIENLTSLEELYLSYNSFSGSIPASIENLTSLKELYLSYNLFSGPIPASIGNLKSLEELDLSYNKMNGTIPESVGQLTKLILFDLFDNSWEGVISEIHFLELSNLVFFSISSSNLSLTFHVRDDWIPSFSHLYTIQIVNCRVGPKFPAWLQIQKYMSEITLTNAAISGIIPDWLWTLSLYRFRNLSLTGNQTLNYLDLSGNNLTGSIPTSISKMKNLYSLDLSNNHLSGNVPRHWEEMNELESINLSNNNLSGDIPSSICSLPELILLKLNNNNLSGQLSSSLRNCIGLRTLDLGENKFIGNLPNWMGERLTYLLELRLTNNMFSGNIPEQLCRLRVHILELGHNNLSGAIPSCLGHMMGFQTNLLRSSYPDRDMELDTKGRKQEYDHRTLFLVNLIDLSNNNLRGEIPREITSLSNLGTLNLARNQLTGKIPEEIGALQWLETLDLSSNHLSGLIPPSMTSITSLSYLNLSYNNLSGQIPSTNQFLTWIDPSIYEGNLLCGPPLPTTCSTSTNGNNTEDTGRDDDDEDEDLSYKFWLFVSVALGFIVGFWVVCGSLVIKKSWRDAYFWFLNEMKDRVYVFVVVNVARLRRKMKFQNNQYGP